MSHFVSFTSNPSRSDSFLDTSPSSADEKQTIRSLVDCAFQHIEYYFAVMVGAPLSSSREILQLTGKLGAGYFPMQMRESLFQEKGFPKIDTTQQHFLSKLFEEYPYFSEVPLFTGLSVCLLDNLKILAKENVKISVREVSEHFCRLHIGLQMYVDAKKDVEKRLFSGQPVAKFCLEALKSSNLSVTPSFFCDALNQMRQDLLKTKETPAKKKVCLIIDVLDLLVKTPGFQEVFYYIELKSYKEMTHKITSIADLLPLISCHARILKVLHDHVTSSDYLDLHRKPLELVEKAIEHLILNDKDQSKSHFLYKQMFKGFVDHSLITAPYLNRFLQYKYDVLHNEPFEVKHIVNAYSQESSFSSFIYIVEKVGHALGLYHNNKAYHILSRLSAMLVHYYGASCMEYEYEFTPPFLELNEIMKEASQITLFDFDDDQREKMMEDFFELFDLKHFESSFKLRLKSAFETSSLPDVQRVIDDLDQEKKNEPERYIKSKKCHSIIPTSLCFFHSKLYKFASFTNFDKRLQKVYQQLLAFIDRLPAHEKTEQLQQAIRNSFADCLGKQLMECLIYHDLCYLFDDNPIEEEEMIPESFLQLMFFEIIEEQEVSAEEIHSDQHEEDLPSLPLQAPLDVATSIIKEGSEASIKDKDFEDIAKKIGKVFQKSKMPKDMAAEKSPTSLLTHQDFRSVKKHRQIRKLFKMLNLSSLRTKGSHEAFGKDGGSITVLPRHTKDLKIGTRLAIWKQIQKSM